MKKFLFYCFITLLSTTLSADILNSVQKSIEQNSLIKEVDTNNTTEINATKFALEQAKILEDKERLEQKLEAQRQSQIQKYHNKLETIHKQIISLDSVWIKSYSTYKTYKAVESELETIRNKIMEFTESDRDEVISSNDEFKALLAKEKILAHQIELLEGENETPFMTLLQPQDIQDVPNIQNPLDIFSGFSFTKLLNQQYTDYDDRKDELVKIIYYLKEYQKTVINLKDINADYQEDKYLKDILDNIEKFNLALDTVQTASAVYAKRISDINIRVNTQIEAQSVKLFRISIVILILFIILFLLKMAAKKYIVDNERFYMANKIMNFTNFFLILIIVLFSYIENVSYLVTVLGFASAGIAIAMKDLFMSMLGWLVIVFGGSIHVGDRIRVDMDGMKYVGDVMDISLSRITLLEDITLTTYSANRRAGRIIFIPNNYVFTRMIANYSHSSLKTVWDGIDITITFDSNHKKAQYIAKEVARKYSKGYTDITRKQLNKLRNNYNLKNTNVEPRIYAFIEENGIKISAWYLTNAYATLTLRSTISMDIIDAFNSENDIEIAFPTQKLHLSNYDNKTVKELPVE